MKTDKIILDLCGGTGAWSAPYKKAGYDVRVITLPEYDIRTTKFRINSLLFRSNINTEDGLGIDYKDVYGILAAPPCTMFSLARTKAKKPRDLREGMETVIACLNIIWWCQYKLEKPTARITTLKFWALENPYAMLKFFLGKPALVFDPWEFGDGYKKRTMLWGWFNEPKKNVFEKPKLPKFGSDKPIEFRFDKELKSITPAGFAKAFYEANK